MVADEHDPTLSATAGGELFGLWQRVWKSGAVDVSREELRPMARAVCAEARAAAIPVERLVILVKESWASHPGLRAHEDRRAMQRILAELVSLCIGEFYREPAGANRRSDAAPIQTARPQPGL